LVNDQNKEQSSDKNQDEKAYKLIWIMAAFIIIILVFGIFLAFYFKNFAIVPFSVVIMGIISFFGVLRISRALTGTNENEMRKSITVSILVVYLGLLPTLAFQGILQFQVTGNKSTELAVLNQTANQTVVQVIPQTIALSETVVTSFTALVAAVLLFYFGSRTLDSYYASGKGGKTQEAPNNGGDGSGESPTETEKETIVAIYDKDEKLVEKTVTTERIKKV
jgi:hypothetical protein